MSIRPRIIRNYVQANGRSPFEYWFLKLRDNTAKAKILNRIDRLRLGNFGDCRSLGEGVFEMRIHYGPGYRVYFGLVGAEVVLLLGGGNKSTQQRDIKMCVKYFKEFRDG